MKIILFFLFFRTSKSVKSFILHFSIIEFTNIVLQNSNRKGRRPNEVSFYTSIWREDVRKKDNRNLYWVHLVLLVSLHLLLFSETSKQYEKVKSNPITPHLSFPLLISLLLKHNLNNLTYFNIYFMKFPTYKYDIYKHIWYFNISATVVRQVQVVHCKPKDLGLSPSPALLISYLLCSLSLSSNVRGKRLTANR